MAQPSTVDVNIDIEETSEFNDLEVHVNGLVSTTTLRFDGDQVRAMRGSGYGLSHNHNESADILLSRHLLLLKPYTRVSPGTLQLLYYTPNALDRLRQYHLYLCATLAFLWC